jgi:hypothetical protein
MTHRKENEGKLQDRLQSSMGSLIRRHGREILKAGSRGDSHLTLTLEESNEEDLQPIVEYLQPGTTVLDYYYFQFRLGEGGNITVTW